MNKIGFMLSLAVAGLAAGAAEDPKLADTTAKATGVLHVQPDGTHQAGFYQIVVDW